MVKPDALAWAIHRDDVPTIRAALHDLGITRASLKRELRWQTLVLTRTDARLLAKHLPAGWVRDRLWHRIEGRDDDQADRDLIRKALVYRSGEDSCNSVYMGSMATALVWQVLKVDLLKQSRVDFDDALAKADRLQLDECMNIARSVIRYMDKNPVSRCPCCGQIVRAKVVV